MTNDPSGNQLAGRITTGHGRQRGPSRPWAASADPFANASLTHFCPGGWGMATGRNVINECRPVQYPRTVDIQVAGSLSYPMAHSADEAILEVARRPGT